MKLAVLILVFALQPPVAARTLTLGSTAGKVRVNRTEARRGRRIRQGDRIETGGYIRRTQSKAVLHFDWNQGVGLIGPRSSIKVERLGSNRGGAITHFGVDAGAMWLSVRKFKNPYSEIAIKYSNGLTQYVRGTEFGISYDGKAKTGAIITKSGAVAVFDSGTDTVIGPGEGVLIYSDGKVSPTLPVVQTLGHDELKVTRSGAFWQVSGRIVNKHCILGDCISEPVESPMVKLFGRNVDANCFGFFSFRTKPPVNGNSTHIEISHSNRKSIIKLKTKGLLPKHP